MFDPVGSSVLIVEPVSGGADVARLAHRLGVTVVVASQDSGECEIPADLRKVVDIVLTVDTNDEQALLDAVGAFHERAPLTAVLPGCDFYVASTARLAARLGLPGLPVATVDAVRNKARMRERIAAAGLRAPRFAEARSLDGLRSAAAHVGYPCVMKPVESSGSIHVSRADDWPQLAAAYTALADDRELDLGRPMGHTVVVEQYVSGREVSTDGYVENGRVTVVAITEKVLGAEPRFVELGHLTPADLPDDVVGDVAEYTAQVVRALNVTTGPFHCELRLNGEGPVLIELGARLAGDGIPELVRQVTGTDLVAVTLAAGLGVDPGELAAFGAPRAPNAAVRFLTADHLDSYSGILGWDELGDLPDVIGRHVSIPPGAPIPKTGDCRSRLAWVRYTAQSHPAAREFWKSLGDLMIVK
ncbi:ATP-grasp domain-containing protein [Sphaerisporangium sp. TRM90804]|uniref:ATP-grasp domain-containing protein n=1 Tax=Sphaerisporangium sp. TRM90804 TaxID=3031113 RepID=UPI002447A6D8|nr:ATP-grasp domain-containing protein [Sphaerisporangium sp. TRM90804]MDH2425014.1 ATP-grasp domain-containing protein [Sphaerisporangium sp. TRM90804]